MNFFDRLFPGFLSKARSIFGLNTITASTQFNNYTTDIAKLAAVLSNPAALKVFALQCDLFSLGEVYVKDKNDKVIEDDPFIKLIKKPNPFQSKSQFLWDYMFMTMIGNDYCYCDSAIVEKKGNKLYHLLNHKIEWPQWMERNKDKMIFSDSQLKEYQKQEIVYRYEDGTTFKFPLDRLIITHDLTNGLGNFYKSPSRLDALYKVISNSEHALDAKNINVRYSGKFLVGSSGQLNTVGLGEKEKEDIIDKMESPDKRVFPLKTMVQIRRFVENMAQLQLDECYLKDYFIIGNMYNIPRDVLEAYVSSTYENQEKARMSHVSYTLQPKGNEFFNSFEVHFGYDEKGKNICIEWDHLPFMHVFKKEKAETNKIVIDSLSLLLKEGVPIDQVNAYLGTKFIIPEKEDTISDNSSPETLAAQAALRGSVGGVQGILAVQASVSAGTTTREAALSILTIIYGFTEEQANDLLGEPNEQSQQEGAGSSGQGEGEEENSEEVTS